MNVPQMTQTWLARFRSGLPTYISYFIGHFTLPLYSLQTIHVSSTLCVGGTVVGKKIPHGIHMEKFPKHSYHFHIVFKWNYGGNSMLILLGTHVEFRGNSCGKVPRKWPLWSPWSWTSTLIKDRWAKVWQNFTQNKIFSKLVCRYSKDHTKLVLYKENCKTICLCKILFFVSYVFQ